MRSFGRLLTHPAVEPPSPVASIPAARQNRSKLSDTASHALPTGVPGTTAESVINLFMALLSFRGIGTPSLQAQREQRRPSFFNIGWGNARL